MKSKRGFKTLLASAVAAACISASLSGCAIVMAMKGSKEPDLKVLEVGATRGQIELQLGAPKSSEKQAEGGSIDTYETELGNEPSPGRAVLHGVADVLTLFIWEPVGTVIESMQGVIRTIQVTYDANDYAASVKVVSEVPSGATGRPDKDEKKPEQPDAAPKEEAKS